MLYSMARENLSDQVTFEQGFERSEGVIHVPIGESARQAIKNKCKGRRARLAQQTCRPVWLEHGKEGCLEGDEMGRVAGDLSADSLVSYCEDLGLLWVNVRGSWLTFMWNTISWIFGLPMEVEIPNRLMVSGIGIQGRDKSQINLGLSNIANI